MMAPPEPYGPRWEPSTDELKAAAEALIEQMDTCSERGWDMSEQDMADLSACLLLLRARGWVPASAPNGPVWAITSVHAFTFPECAS